MNFLKLDNNARFSNKTIMFFLLPILFEQLMVAGLSIADTFMVAGLGETAVAGVSLVARIDNFVKQFIVALAQGGSVVLSQYIGARNDEKSRLSLKNNIRIVLLIGMSIMFLVIGLRAQILKLFFGNAEPEVLNLSLEYFGITAFLYPFIALYYSCSASFRAMGNSKLPSVSAIAMMVINLILKYTFIFKLNMGVRGAALSTLISMAVVGFSLFFMLYQSDNKVVLSGFFKQDLKRENAKRILKVSVPNGIEQGMFQLGALFIGSIISSLGTAAIAADSVSDSLSILVHSMGASFTVVMMIVVSQCIGADSPREAKMYTKHILKLDYLLTAANAAIFLLFSKLLINLFSVSPEAKECAFNILFLYALGSAAIYPTGFALAGGLRGAGDTKFVMYVSMISMFTFRIGAAYLFAIVLEMGIMGAWVAMICDWAIRSVIFIIRFRSGKWINNKVI